MTNKEQEFITYADSKGVTILGPGVEKTYSNPREYRSVILACGHKQDIRRTHFLQDKVRCRTCKVELHRKQAKDRGLELVGPAQGDYAGDSDYRMYRHELCGHFSNISVYGVSTGNFSCQTCTDIRHKTEAKKAQLELVGSTGKHLHRLYKMPCGHTKEFSLTHVREDAWRCDICQVERWKSFAEDIGLEWLSQVKGRTGYSNYKLPCGCVRELQQGNVSDRKWSCPEHFPYFSAKKPSYLYVFHIYSMTGHFLKFGFSNDPVKRKEEFQLKNCFMCLCLIVFPLKNGYEALAHEKRLHRKYKEHRLPDEHGKYYMESGFTECYPDNIKNALIEDIKDIDRNIQPMSIFDFNPPLIIDGKKIKRPKPKT